MADIVPFPQEAGRRSPDLDDPGVDAPAAPEELRAEVVIFPGVRIERKNFSLADRLPRRKASSPDTGNGKPQHGQS